MATPPTEPSAASRHPLPDRATLSTCRRCPLWQEATQGVPGNGSGSAHVLLVGEQPGDEEDREGLPFVGPAGRLLRRALADAGLDAGNVFMTNAVKHFHNELRGKRRIHKTPTQRHIEACRVWLEQEIAALAPSVIVTLGATALVGIVATKIAIRDARERTLTHASGARVVATYHPSAALRAPDTKTRDALYATIVADLRKAAELAAPK